MAQTLYILLPSNGLNFTDFGLDYSGVSLVGEDVQFTGSGGTDAVFARPGLIFDFTLSGVGADKLYLTGSFASYSSTVSGNVITLTRGAGSSAESVTVSYTNSTLTSDVIIFSDGKLSAYTLSNYIKNGGAAPVLSTVETSLAPASPASADTVLDANIVAYGLKASGDTFASMRPGMKFQAISGSGVDKVYVNDGTIVDATLLGTEQDLIFLRGSWSEYTKSIAGNTLTLSRNINGLHEQVVTTFTTSSLTSDRLVFQDGSVTTYAAKAAFLGNAAVAISSIAGYDATRTTPGINPTPQSSVNGVSNLDVTSNIVLNYGQNISAVAGKYLHIVNDGGVGFHGESAANTLDILVTDTSQVVISNGKVSINPSRDLDFSNNYHISIDAGAFKATATGSTSLAFDGTNTLKFSTVTPGTSASGDMTLAAQSQVMDSNGNLIDSYKWFDIERVGGPGDSRTLNLSAGKYALVAKDYSADGATYQADPDQGNKLVATADGIKVGDFNVSPTGFGADDLVYIDNQGNTLNDLSATPVVSNGSAPTIVQFSGISDSVNKGLGGLINLTLAGTSTGFVSLSDMQAYLQSTQAPVYTDVGSYVAASPATQSVSGSVIDGYLKSASVYLDVNKNGKYDAGTDVQVGTTDAMGHFAGTINTANAGDNLLVVGGTDVSTGLAFNGLLKAPATYTVVNPLTTLVSYLNDAGVTGAEAKVLGAFGLTSTMSAAGATLSSFDPMATLITGGANAVAAAKVQAVALQVANLIVSGSAAVVGASTDAGNATKISTAANAVMTAFADAIKTGASFDLTDGAVMTTLLSSAALKSAATSSGLTLNTTSLASKAAAAGVALDAINTVIGNSVTASTAATAAADLAKAVQAQYLAQNASSTSLVSALASNVDSTSLVQSNYSTLESIQSMAAIAPLPQLDPTAPSVQVATLNATLVTGTTYNLSGTLSRALSASESLKISYDGGVNWAAVDSASISGTTISLTGKTLGSSGLVYAKVVDTSNKSGLGFVKDFISPNVTAVTDNVPGTANTSTPSVTYTYTFNEAVTGLTASSFTPTNGTVSSVTGSGTTWTVNVVPASGVPSGNIGLALKAGAVTDIAGNPNVASSQSTQAIDTVVPTVTTVTDNVAGTANLGTASISYTYAFSESVFGLDAADFAVSNGAVTSVTGSGTTWTVNVAPATAVPSGTVGVTLNAGGVTDAANNPNALHTQSSQNLDTLAPTLQSMQLSGSQMTLTFSEPLDAGHLPSPTNLSVQLNGAAVAVNSLSVNGSQLILTLASTVAATTGSVSYTDPTAGDDVAALQDASGNDAGGFTNDFSASAALPTSPLELRWVSTSGTAATTSSFEVWLKSGYKVGSADLSIALDPTKASFAIVDGSTPSGSDFIVANNAANPAIVGYISLNAPTGPVKLFGFNATTLASSGTVYDLYMQYASLGFEDGTHTSGTQTPAVGRFVVGGTGSDTLNLTLVTTGNGPEPATLIGGTAADTGIDVARIDIAAVAASFTGALAVVVESSTVWHIKDSSATPKIVADVLVKTATTGTSYDLVFHKPNSTDTVTESLINVEQLKFFNGNTFLSGWKLSDHSVLTA